jgi:rhodanese-related sulfurtransferase
MSLFRNRSLAFPFRSRGLPGLSLAVLLALPLSAAARTITVEELADRLVAGNVPFLVDVRRAHDYDAAHIPNAANIPARLLGSRKLPPIGEVIVYGDGFGRVDMDEVLRQLAAKPGIQPVLLEGGFAAWASRSGVTTAESGLQPARETAVTYQNMVVSAGRGTVIYDLRKQRGQTGRSDDLKDRFPEARIGEGAPGARVGGGGGNRGAAAGARPASGNPLLRDNPHASGELIVLVDDDHTTAEQVARRLRASGHERVAVLAGGDLIMRHEGRPGLERRGAGSVSMDLLEPANDEQGGENP